MKLRLPLAALAVSFGLAAGEPAAAQCSADLTCGFNSCRTPAFAQPSALWGELKPTVTGQLPTGRDNTDFDEFQNVDNETQPHWMSLDIENGWIFAGITRGLQIWDARTVPADPVRVELLGRSAFPTWPTDPHVSDPVRDVDAPDGVDTVVAVSLAGDGGLSIFNTADKPNTVGKYGDQGKETLQVYAAHIGSTNYAFAATKTGGLLAYNMTAATNLAGLCTENTPGQTGCGVYVGKIGTGTNFSYVDGVGDAAGTNHWIAASSGLFARGVEIWKVTTPGSPTRMLAALTTEFVHGATLWRNGSSYYLAVRVDAGAQSQARVYNVSCIAAGNCTGLAAAIWTRNLVNDSGEFFITDSKSGSRDFLYFGSANRCNATAQNEWLFDVSNPTAPRDVTPPDALVNGVLRNYWSIAYRRTATGYNFVNPRMGKFAGKYFYRQAYTLFDIHELTTGGPPTAAFIYSPAQVYRGEPVSFTDQSTGVPNQWAWTFQDGVPASSTAQNPAGVVFSSIGTKAVTLTSTNGLGSSAPASQNISVLDPAAQVGTVTATPNPALICQGVSFQATGITGLPPLTNAWQVRNASNVLVASGGNVNPFVWDTSSAPAGTYTATVTVSNSAGSDTATSPTVTVNALPALSFTSPGGAPETLNGPPFGSGLVDFRIQTTGATEWRWDFGDGTTPVWTSDPVNGPAPMHTYANEGTYSVTVEIRNCQQGAIASQATSVTIPNTTPLVPSFAAQGLFCTGLGCFGTAGVPITFADSSQGNPNFWDYSWDGDSTFEDADHTAPVTSHTYPSPGIFRPKLRVRRGTVEAVFDHAAQITIDPGASTVTVTSPGEGEVGQQIPFSVSVDVCTPAPTSWSWDLGDIGHGTIVGSTTGTSIQAVYDSLGMRTVTATAVGGGCNGAAGSAAIAVTGGALLIFSDSFETGDTTAWTLEQP